MTLTLHPHTQRYPTCDCVIQNGIWLTQHCVGDVCDTHSMKYLRGANTPNYPVPATIGYVSINSADYRGISYIDTADHDCPDMLWMHDAWVSWIRSQ